MHHTREGEGNRGDDNGGVEEGRGRRGEVKEARARGQGGHTSLKGLEGSASHARGDGGKAEGGEGMVVMAAKGRAVRQGIEEGAQRKWVRVVRTTPSTRGNNDGWRAGRGRRRLLEGKEGREDGRGRECRGTTVCMQGRRKRRTRGRGGPERGRWGFGPMQGKVRRDKPGRALIQ
jgi:hypothetical protein